MTGERRASLLTFTAVAVAALVVRLVHLVFFAEATPFFDPAPWNTPMNPMDTGEYDRWAMQILGGDAWWTDHGQGEYFQSPVYPYFVALIYLLAGGRSIMAVAVVQAVLGAATCGMTAILARRLITPAAGWLAGGLAVVYAPGIFYGSFLLKESLATFLLSTALTHTVFVFGKDEQDLLGEDRAREHDGEAGPARAVYRLFLAGFLWGAALASWPLLVPLALVAMAWIAWQAAPPAAGPSLPVVARVALLLTGTVLAVAPCTLRNVVGEGRFVLLSDAGPRNWQVGNATNSTGTYIDFPRDPLAPVSAPLSGRFWSQYAGKLILFSAARDIPQVVDGELLRPASPVLRRPLPGWGFLLPFALAGLLLAWRRNRWWGFDSRWVPLYVIAVGYPLLMSLFFIVGRFRLPVAPVYMIFAALAAHEMRGLATRAAWSGPMPLRGLTAMGVVLLAAVAVNVPRPLPRGAYPFHHTWASYHLEKGDAAWRAGQGEVARSAWQKVLKVPFSPHRGAAEKRLQQQSATPH